MSADTRTPVRSLVWVGIILPLLISGTAAALQIAWLSELPDPAATHWPLTGGPDASGSASVFPISTVAAGLLMPVLLLATLPSVRRGGAGFATRLLGSASLGLAGLMAVIATWSVAVQRGLEDAASAPGIGVGLLVALAALVVLTVLGWLVQPAAQSGRAEAGDGSAAPIAVAAQERVAWLGHASTSRWLWLLPLAPLGILVALVVGGEASAAAIWIVVGVTVITVVAMLASTAFSILVDGRGLTVRSTLGWPRLSVPVHEISSATVIEVSPIADFGGWGLRRRPGATGVVTRAGEALEITRDGGGSLVVTVDDAATAAGLLIGLRDRARA